MLSRRLIIPVIALGVFLAGCQTLEKPHDDARFSKNDAVYYLVRHAEKELDKPDPALNDAGVERALALKDRLSNVPLSAIYSSDYKRTRDTAAPVAKDKNLDVIIYDARDLDGLAKTLKTQDGMILVVGHSNTTPQLSELLGGDPGDPIIEASEYDRLYRLVRHGDTVSSTIERFGN